MSIKSFIKNNIIDLDDDKKEIQPTIQKKTQPTQPKAQISISDDTQWKESGTLTQNTSPDYNTTNSSALDKSRRHFEQILKGAHDVDKSNDYYSFIMATKAMSSIPVESERYKVAYAGLSAAGLTKDIIVQTANKFIGVIDQERQNFLTAFAPSFKEQVEDKKAAIEQKRQKMVDLSQQIQSLNEEIKKLGDEVNDTETNMVQNRNAFDKAGQEAKDQITSELQKIEQYLS